ncbi:MAG TPA: ethanolamine ammonia-lyase reactivating factor EutA [Chloroflexi bacterium]|nr:ethanolamine ammonia-lyase reactivating factor EutA [Chloroflexota bacterium]
MAEPRAILSVGIDVGTTTTQVVFSRLALADVARPGQIPRVAITGREVIYQSPITFTPLLDRDTVDAARLEGLVRSAYAAAGVQPEQVETGAVIITGETAKKKNADQILAALAGLAGEFVVSVAGPHVESMISGRGAGAAHYSQVHFTTVTNVDIGGGSANSATFRSGVVVATAAMNYGGRILEIDGATARVRAIAEPAQRILTDCGLRLGVGDVVTMDALRRFTDRMADLTVELIEGTASPLAQQLYLTPPAPVSGRGTVLMFSGGIGHYYYAPAPVNSVAEVAIHGDVGPLLADAIRRHPALAGRRIVPPAETVRATVLGAGTQTVTLSGSTIWAEREILPLRNAPVVRPEMPPHWERRAVAAAIDAAVTRWDIDRRTDAFAIALESGRTLDYNALVELAAALNDFAATMPPDRPLVVIIERDYAQALGQTVKASAPQRPLLVIDQVGLTEGDYIDVGLPMLDGRVVPLSIKTLVFYR